MKGLSKILLSLALAASAAGCTSEANAPTEEDVDGETSSAVRNINIEMKSPEEQVAVSEYTYEEYKQAFDEIVAEANALDLGHELEKWAVRVLAEEKFYYETDLTGEQVIQMAEQAEQEDETWKEVATEEYGVEVTDEEVENFYQEVTANYDANTENKIKAYTEALGVTTVEFFQEYDRDLAVKSIMWAELKEKLGEKHDTTDNNVLVEKYRKEVEEYSGR